MYPETSWWYNMMPKRILLSKDLSKNKGVAELKFGGHYLRATHSPSMKPKVRFRRV